MLYDEGKNRTIGSKSKQKKNGPQEINMLLSAGPFIHKECVGRRPEPRALLLRCGDHIRLWL